MAIRVVRKRLMSRKSDGFVLNLGHLGHECIQMHIDCVGVPRPDIHYCV